MLFRFFCIALCVAAASACRREAIRVYVAPKDPVVAQPDSPASPRSRPRLTWHLPKGWQQTDPGQVSVANFVVKSATGDASINITPMPNLAGRESMVVNMWREQLHQPPLREEEITAALTPVQIGSETGHLFELTNEQRQIVTAMLHRADSSWFFKLAGDTATVAAKKPEFLAFLKTVSFPESSDEVDGEDSAATTSFHWTVPEGWQKAAPGQMQVAKFLVTGADDKKSEVTVSIFPNNTGGTLLNVNRWRKQIGLAPIDEAELKQAVTALDPNTPDAVLADLTNENGHRLLGAIVPRGGQWFFYKMLGDAGVVAEQRDAFIAFAKSSP
jgi:hypothetical protein